MTYNLYSTPRSNLIILSTKIYSFDVCGFVQTTTNITLTDVKVGKLKLYVDKSTLHFM